MEIGINWDAYDSDDLEAQVQAEIFRKNGVRHTFIPDDCTKETIAVIKENGIEIDTVHAPFRGINNMWLEGSKGDEMLSSLKHSVDLCRENDIPVAIVHLSSGDDCPCITDLGHKRFADLMEYADKSGVIIAFENQRKLANLAFAMEEFHSARFCWDCGHEACFAYGREFMPLFSSRLIALHLHDNFAIHEGDKHMIPFDAKIDFDKVSSHIASSEFEGTVMLELSRHTSGFYETLSPEEFFSKAASAAKKIADKIEAIRAGA